MGAFFDEFENSVDVGTEKQTEGTVLFLALEKESFGITFVYGKRLFLQHAFFTNEEFDLPLVSEEGHEEKWLRKENKRG